MHTVRHLIPLTRANGSFWSELKISRRRKPGAMSVGNFAYKDAALYSDICLYCCHCCALLLIVVGPPVVALLWDQQLLHCCGTGPENWEGSGRRAQSHCDPDRSLFTVQDLLLSFKLNFYGHNCSCTMVHYRMTNLHTWGGCINIKNNAYFWGKFHTSQKYKQCRY